MFTLLVTFITGVKIKVNLRNINFDIATTVDKTKEGKAKGSAKIIVVDISLGGNIAKTDSIVSRISFTIPVVLPNPQKVEKDKPVIKRIN